LAAPYFAAPGVNKCPQLSETEYWLRNSMNAFARPAGRLFFMISGLFLLVSTHHRPALLFLARRTRGC
jgi:surface polysaccharide O-acyltransferase-like enzyme